MLRRCARRRLHALAAATFLLLPSQGVARDGFRLRVEVPGAPESGTRFRLLEVKGRAGAVGGNGHDLVIVLDLSESTLHDSGVDLDGDGPTGRTDHAFLTSLREQPDAPPSLIRRLAEERDFEDTVLAAELEAASALLERLDPRRFRVGLVVFSDAARVVAPVGSSRAELGRALAEVRRGFHRELRGTNLGAAIEVAHGALVPDLASPPIDRQLGIVLLSDGAPTLPVHGDRARDFAVEAAVVAGLAGIRLHAFAIGREGARALETLEEMASLTGGRVVRIERPAETPSRLRRLDLANLAGLEIENETTGVPARALRTFPDGAFDAFVELIPGTNRIRFTARSVGGERASVERRVTYPNGEARTPEDAASARALLEELRRRTEELQLWAEIERRRRIQKRVLEMMPVGPGDAAPE